MIQGLQIIDVFRLTLRVYFLFIGIQDLEIFLWGIKLGFMGRCAVQGAESVRVYFSARLESNVSSRVEIFSICSRAGPWVMDVGWCL